MKICLVGFLMYFTGFLSMSTSNYLRDKNKAVSIGSSDHLVEEILNEYPQYFREILERKNESGVQIIYTQINRRKNSGDKIKFQDHYFNVNHAPYYYPASTVKFPIVCLAIQKINELHIPGLDMFTTMITGKNAPEQTEVKTDSSAADNHPCIAQYIKKILLVSDNDAFNRLYEFLGQEYINYKLHEMGYVNTQIIHRLSISLGEEQNRHTNPIYFYDINGKLIYTKPAERSQYPYDIREVKMGNGYMQGNQLIHEPFDFSKKNRFPLTDFQTMVRSIMFPESVKPKQKFFLKKEDYNFLRKYMSMRPGESDFPKYPAPEYWDNYVKMIYYGSEKSKPEPGIRIFNKVGTAYGFLIESCYFADFTNHIEFMLSAAIYCNSDGIFNDDKYDYETIGYPFFKNLGHVIYEYEMKRKRKHPPDLSSFRFSYNP